MTPIRNWIIGLVAACAALPAFALNLGAASPSYDGVYYVSQYPTGNKPVVSCSSPSGWTLANLGDGGGQICEVSASEFTMGVSGSAQPLNGRIAYKDAGAADVQLTARITDTYSGATSNFANIGIGIRESAASTSWLFQIHSLQSGATGVQCQYGSNGTYTTTNGASGALRPHTVNVTYDLSSGDIKAFAGGVEVCSTNRAMSDVIAYVGGTSRSTSEQLAATLDNIALSSTITAYTPTDPLPGAPTVVSAIDNQAWASGTAVSLSCAANFSGATSYSIPANGSAGGLPTGTGMSFNTSLCAFSGTPDSDDVGTRTLTVTATNAGGSVSSSFESAVSAAPPGDVFQINTQAGTTTRVYNCASASTGAGGTTSTNGSAWSTIRTSGTGSAPGPGDTIVLQGGTHHGKLQFVNCVGSSSGHLVIKNKTTDASPAIIEKSNGSGGGFWLQITDSLYVDLDGRGGYSGHTSGCGAQSPLLTPKTDCGIVWQFDASEPLPTSAVKINGTTSKYGIYGLEIDGTGGTGGGVALDCHDNTQVNGYSGTGTYTGSWIEDVTVSENWIHDYGVTSGEGMYCGSNAVEDAFPLRFWRISYNYVDNTARECINLKYARQGPNYIDHNVVKDCASANDAGQIRGINVTDGGDVYIYDNIVIDNKGNGISHIINGAVSADPLGPNFYLYIYNNIVIRSTGVAVYVESANSSQDQITPVSIYNNTLVNPVGNGITRSVASGTCEASDNIITDSATPVSGCGSTNNRTGTTAAQNFVNSGSDNYELTSTSGACNNGSANGLSEDYEGESRPQDGANDQGADEATACP